MEQEVCCMQARFLPEKKTICASVCTERWADLTGHRWSPIVLPCDGSINLCRCTEQEQDHFFRKHWLTHVFPQVIPKDISKHSQTYTGMWRIVFRPGLN